MRPTLAGEVIESVQTEYSILLSTSGGWFLRIEGDCIVEQSGQAAIQVTEGDFTSLHETLQVWVGRAIDALEYRNDGGMVVRCDGHRIVIPPSPDFEAWGLAGPNQELIVSTPGGEIGSWE